jgi:tetratricopeptide (TPR) repeat protein
MDLPSELANEIQHLMNHGDTLLDEGEEQEALVQFTEAWDLLPEPKGDWQPTVPILAAIADCYFYLGEWEASYLALQDAIRCGADVSNPFIRLRLGQCLYEKGDSIEAANWLAPAYLAEGIRLFIGEEPKYLMFIKEKLSPPPDGWPAGW